MSDQTLATLLFLSPVLTLWALMTAAEAVKTISAIREGRHEI